MLDIIRFQRRCRDAKSGPHYNRYRYYAPELGRYVTQDPIGLAGGENFYQYPSPTTLVDPMGLDPEQTWWGKLKQTAAEWGIRPGGAQLEHRPIDPERLPPGVQSSIPVGDGIGEACNDKEIGLGGLGMVDKLLGKILGNKGGAGLGVGGDIACVDPSITAHKTAESAVNGIVEGSGAAGAGLRAIRDARERRDKEAGL